MLEKALFSAGISQKLSHKNLVFATEAVRG
jgi:hypothetical protein